ncbi:hypothetical protein C8J55DRAFT_558327 [Lentinula edodes]|uniref:EF-hand domain-containing protein n=1 Tax=Lentinula lateritia TaxID=40482 RepID=A0A9W9AP78_9AGAR|nr:hypothetical protein C8J55DRAFT_558327 [Lentinula edodes]
MDNTNDYVANTTANRVPLPEARRKSAEALEKVDQLVKEATALKSGKDKGNRTRRILEYLRDGIRYAESISTANNFAEAAVSLLRVIIEQEISRRQNNEQIVVAYCMLSSATFTIRYIERSHINEDLTSELDTEYIKIHAIIEQFGVIATAYYATSKRPLVAFLKASEFKRQMMTSMENCNVCHTKIRELLQLHVTSTVESTAKNVLSIISRLDRAETQDDKKACNILVKYGKDGQTIIGSDRGLQELATLFSEHVTGKTKHILQEDIEEILKEYRNDFLSKMEFTQQDINENVQRLGNEIMAQLTSGPHNLIKDPIFRNVWSSQVSEPQNGSQVSRAESLLMTFAPGLERIQMAIYKLMTGPFQLYLKLCVDHPAISDAIDEDGSGYVSAHEFNSFLMQKPSQWTFPKWLFFWAIGWQDTMFMIYNISKQLCMVSKAAKSKAKHDLLKGDISKYIDSLQVIIPKLTDWYNITGYEYERHFGLESEADTQFHSLVQEYQELNKQLAEKIIQDGGILSDAVDISPLKRRFRDRIEMCILPFLENILLHQFEALVGRPYANYNAYNNGKGSDQADEEISAPTVQFDNKTVEDIQWMDMIDTLKELFIQFHLRMLSLLRGWKKQKINCQVMIDSFSGGLFAGWHTAYMGDRNFKHMIDILIHNDNLDSGNETPTDDISVLQKSVTALQTSVYEIHTSLEELTKMISSMHLSSQQVPSQPHVHNGLQGPPEIQYPLFEETESDNDGENLSLNGHQHSRSGSSENNAPELPENNDNWDARKQDMESNFDNDDSPTLQALNESQPQVYSNSAYNDSEYNNDQGQRWQELEQEQEQEQSDAYGF